MATIRIPTPLRPYTAGNEHVPVTGTTVGEALDHLVTQYPELKPHLFNEGKLRSFVNVFLGEEDVRHLNGIETPLQAEAKLLIIPSIAGGAPDSPVRKVDHSALRTNQAFIIGLLLAAFVTESWIVVAFVGLVMIVGTIFPGAGLFKLIYARIFRPLTLIKPDVIEDNPEPHRFAQGLGGAFLAGSVISLLAGLATAAASCPASDCAAGSIEMLAGLPILGWALAWIVIVLASLNLFVGFCAGCFVYYQLNRLSVPGFRVAPIKRERAS